MLCCLGRPKVHRKKEVKSKPKVKLCENRSQEKEGMDLGGGGDDGSGPTKGGPNAAASASSGIVGVSKYNDKYDMNHKDRGVAVIISNKEFEGRPEKTRHGAEVDAAEMERAFQDMGFKEVLLYENVFKQEFNEILSCVSELDYTNLDCFAMAIMTHGNEDVAYVNDTQAGKNRKKYVAGSNIEMHDGLVNLDDVFAQFKGNVAHPSLRGKPKLFFIQACRGKQRDKGTGILTQQSDSDPFTDDDIPLAVRIPVEADFLVHYSSTEGYVSGRSPITGTPFIQTLCQEIQKRQNDTELLTLLTRVNGRVAFEHERRDVDPKIDKTKQMPCFVSKLTKLTFFPRS